MFENKKIQFEYWKDNVLNKIVFDGNYSSDTVDVIQLLIQNEKCEELKLIVKPHVEIKIHSLVIEMKYTFNMNQRIFVNGYQSWTDSRELFIDEKMKHLSKLATPLLNKYQFHKYGDYSFKKYSNRVGDFHGFTYGYIRHQNEYHLIGSLSEKNGFTIFNTSVKDSTIRIEKECDGLTIDHDYEAFNLVSIKGNESYVFDQYFAKMNINKPSAKAMTGWTSWYNYYQNINEEIIVKNLEALKKANKTIDIFQIDDGFQTFVGDWLDIDHTKFPNGMKVIADKIHAYGYKAGIWLAPFVCETNSRIFREKPEWILKDSKGEMVLAGSNWSRFYALDIELTDVRSYIKNVFDTVLNTWGYDLVKLDFLYAVCLIPRKNKTRGQVMCESMEFLRECINDKLILGCGVPLGPSFGQVDYCRIGCDVGLDWDDKPFMRLFHRERVSTLNAIGNAIGRWHLNDRAFINDPDVFFLREDNISLTQTQKETVAFVNKHFGRLIFTSDDITLYNDAQHKHFDQAMKLDNEVINQVIPYRNGLIEVHYSLDNKNYIARLNLTDKTLDGINAYETRINEVKEMK
jgi:alpha-galactosidase